MKISNENKFIALIFILAIFVRIVALFWVEPINQPQTWEYEEIANNLLNGKGLFWTFDGKPYRATYIVLYPLLTSLVYKFTAHSFLAMKILQIFISLLTCFLIYKISLRIFERGTAILALFLASFHPGLIYYCVRMHSLVLDAFLFTLTLFLFMKVIEGNKIYGDSILFGMVFGLTLLSRSTIGPFLLFALLLILLRFKDNLLMVLRVMILIIASATLILFPLWIRNYLLFKKVVFTSSEAGLTFWLGFNEYATGTNKTMDGKFILEAAPQEFRERIKSLDEFGQNQYFYQTAFNFIKDHPFKAISLFFRRIKYFWWFTPTQGWEYPKIYFIIYKFYWIGIFSLFIFGLYLKLKKNIKGLMDKYYLLSILSIFFTLTLVHAFYNLDGRHRWALESIVLIFSAKGLDYLKFKKKSTI